MERRRMRRKSGFGKRMMVTMLSLIMLLGVFNPGLLAGAEETNFMDSFINAYDQQTQSGSETMGSLALSYIAKYDVLKAKGQALDTAAQDYAAQVEALNAEITVLDAAVAADAAAGLLTEAEVTAIRAAAVGSASTATPVAPTGDASLKKQTVTCFEDNKTFAVTGNLPDGTTLSVTKLESEVNDYIHNHILGLDALPAGYTGEAFDIKLLDKDGNAFQPAEQVNVGVTADGVTENSDITVYHLPDTSADDVYAGYNKEVNGISLMRTVKELVGEKIETVNTYEGYYAFLTDGFSTYYVVAGSQSDNSGNDTFNILRGVSVQLTNVTTNNYTVTYPAGVTAGSSGVNITRNNNTLTFAATNSAALGTYSIEIDSTRTATINIMTPRAMFDAAPNKSVYFTCLRNSTNIPIEPMSGGGYQWVYFGQRNGSYTFSGYGGAYASNPEPFINLDKVASSSELEQNLKGQNVIGVIDRGVGMDTLECLNFSSEEWHSLLKQLVRDWDGGFFDSGIKISDGQGGELILTEDMVDEKLEDGSYRYRMYPYVIKLILDETDNQRGWHVDCAITDMKTYSVSYEYNLPSAAIIDENSQLIRPNTTFHKPGTDNVKVGVLKLDSKNITGDNTVTIYDADTQTTSEYKFLYWSTSPDGSGTRYNPDDTLPKINSNVVLYAIWDHTQTSGTVKIQKTEVFEDPNDTRKNNDNIYSFEISFANAEEGKEYPYIKYDASGAVISEKDAKIVSSGNFTLKHDDYIVINNVPGGAVIVAETVAADAKYTASWTVGSTVTNANTATGTVSAGNQIEMVCKNTYAPLESQVTVSKTVTGNMGDQAKGFEFTASVSSGSMQGMTYKYSDSDTVNTISGSTCTFNLKHGQSVVFDKVPIGSILTVKESDSNYTPYYRVNNAQNETQSDTASVEAVTDGTASIAFRNDNQVTIDTGIELNSFPFIMMLSSCIVMAIFFLIGKKRMMF